MKESTFAVRAFRAIAAPAALGALISMAACATPHVPSTTPEEREEMPKPIVRVPSPLIEHRLTPAQISTRIEDAEKSCDAALATIAALPASERTFANTMEALDLAVAAYMDAATRLGILKDIHTDREVRAAAAQAEERAGKYFVKLASRRDLYAAVKAFSQREELVAKLAPVEHRLLTITLRDFRRNGLELDDAGLAKLVELRTRLTELGTQYQQNLNENTDSIEITKSEEAGLPESFVKGLQKGKQGLIVTTKYPHYFPFMENAKSESARKRLFIAFQSREAKSNMPLLTEAIKLRDEEAKLLGYATHADFVTEDLMSGSGAAVKSFLGDLRGKLTVKRDSDYAKLTELKRLETKNPKAKLEPWDMAYYFNKLKLRDYALDTEKIREYFPAERVIEGMLAVYEKLFSIKMIEQPQTDAWFPGVTLYAIKDAITGEFIANFYLDLYPREGKYGHAACAGLAVARQVGGQYLGPIALMMANFSPPTGDRPALLTHDEVKTLFHEFGHVMHQTLTTARFGSQSGTSVARDFVEAPSQMLENWVYEKEALDMMSGHYLDSSKKLPAETIEKLRLSRGYNAGYHYTRQVFLATFDQTLHTSGPQVDPDATDKRLYAEIMGLAPVSETHFGANFGHLMGGYDAGYYGYLWSEVFADDLYTRFKERGVLDPEVGRAYREIILGKGRSEEPNALLEQFLGRAPNNAAFLQKVGIQ